MDHNTLSKASQRLNSAKAAYDSVKTAANWADFETAWSDFLMASGSFYTKLEQGSKKSNKSANWFSKKKHERKNDPLLSYMHQARNSDEHGIEPVAEELQVGRVTEAGTLRSITTNDGVGISFSMEKPDGTIVETAFSDPKPTLARVTNRGVIYDPPSAHLGKAIAFGDPYVAAGALLGHLELMLKEAMALDAT